ncbi:hypothetical protein UFOVP181_8 [uncultured Caudovirales phage]|uniref:Uncharacterized protein n=1 Tax=uncultured Caudovirales phage TaxID=2100421 RepID=A0A6J5KWF6_9CAUD|nr:hypothetical protein UFOVP57_155 [uncultured Caudovirales phage]CAB5208385.1 hypothetical protein UFOVP181_8 [uncultured Caudovirales phage]
MNERIKQLALQAGYSKDFLAIGLPNNMEKFAELIVRECATAFEAEVNTWKEIDPYQGSIKRQGTKAIKQHFGVEE